MKTCSVLKKSFVENLNRFIAEQLPSLLGDREWWGCRFVAGFQAHRQCVRVLTWSDEKNYDFFQIGKFVFQYRAHTLINRKVIVSQSALELLNLNDKHSWSTEREQRTELSKRNKLYELS